MIKRQPIPFPLASEQGRTGTSPAGLFTSSRLCHAAEYRYFRPPWRH